MRALWVVIALAFAAAACIDTGTLAAWFTHPLLADRAGVPVRDVTLRGAVWFRVACAIAAFAWIACPIALARLAREPQLSPTPRATDRLLPRSLVRVLMAMVGVGLALRMLRVGESFWFDELSALLDYAQYGVGPSMGTYFVQSNHVLHTMATAIAVEWASGANEVLLRAPALIAGVLLIPAWWWLGSEAVRWRSRPCSEHALIHLVPSCCAACAALMPICVLESVEARGYSLVMLLAAVAGASLLRAMRIGSTNSYCVYAAACALGVWTHLTFVALPAGHALVLLLRACANSPQRLRDARRGAVGSLIALLLASSTALALLAPLMPDLLRIRGEFRALDGNEPTLLSPEGGRILLGVGGSWWLDAFPGVSLAIIGIAGMRRDRCRALPVALALAGLPLMVVGTALCGSWMYARFALFAAPGAALAISYGALAIAERARSRRARQLCALGALALSLMWVSTSVLLPPKQPIRDAIAFVHEHAAPDAAIACAGLPDNVPAYYGILVGRTIADAGSGGSALGELTPSPEWLIVLYPASLQASASAALAQEWELSERFAGWVDWSNGDVCVYRRR